MINKKYKISLVGNYNSSVYICPYCSADFIKESKNLGSLPINIIGFSESNSGLMAIVECPNCFSKFYFHADKYIYDIFLDFINLGIQKHFKKDGEL